MIFFRKKWEPWDSVATIQTMGVNLTTIDYLRALVIEIGGKTIILMVVDARDREHKIWGCSNLSQNARVNTGSVYRIPNLSLHEILATLGKDETLPRFCEA